MPDIGTIIPSKSRDNCRLSAGEGNFYPASMAMKFRDALMAAVEQTGVTWAQLARDTGVSYEQLKKLKQGKSLSTNVDDGVLIANYFGMSMDEFIGDMTQAERREILDLYSKLSAQERDLLLAASRGRHAPAQD